MKDGGPAFPRYIPREQFRNEHWETVFDSYGGMSLRDYFAAAALPAVMRARVALVNADLANDLGQESIVEECYELADAMLEAREKGDEPR